MCNSRITRHLSRMEVMISKNLCMLQLPVYKRQVNSRNCKYVGLIACPRWDSISRSYWLWLHSLRRNSRRRESCMWENGRKASFAGQKVSSWRVFISAIDTFLNYRMEFVLANKIDMHDYPPFLHLFKAW